MTAIDNLFANGANGDFMVLDEAIDLTCQSLHAYWSRHSRHAIAWSGGKDSTALLTVVIHLIDTGRLPQPERLHVFYADTRQELPPIQQAAEAVIARLRQRNWIEVHVVRAPLDKRFMVYILGRGVPPPNNNTLRWCTRQIKVEPMAEALISALADLDETALMLTGVRQGESAIRDDRIVMSCSKDGAECGQGWYQQVLPDAKGIRGRIATLAPILHWRVCHVWDWIGRVSYAPGYGEWPVSIMADAYGGDDAADIAARTGCIGCPLTEKDTALEIVSAMQHWSHLSALLELKPLYRWMRMPKQRHRKRGVERLKDGSIAKNPQRMGPLTLEARAEALERVLDIQHRARVDLINEEEEARIRELIAARTFPDKWDGDEPRADAWLDSVLPSGAVQPILFRDLVGQ
ncbi:DNA sulfur modification protein DndC [Sphingomonas gellani]|uniref:DNA sulfur modification protein DndC n=1 Tax=Sphingomonas gellani TaxID=1166340 RepID=A0A1H7ZU82_9SPHN|nr:phosphoadenosine phosphosulfate reductase family protein [Sphingomonas gellani]SEM62192.1 DNA sulfur modification protein DndC [Sphingomonas gellani]